ncbi:MAG: tRNA threonylcarbamoyladenosine dehydratase [Clostridia bacterium]|nr:tRNA threonylcarbamoyladenosine dehydratase [Clostridia bacterium]
MFTRTQLLIGSNNLQLLQAQHVAVFGVGGVGAFCAEALARAGIGKLTIVDNDVVKTSNLNRQLIATTNTIGQHKVEVLKQRLLQINASLQVEAFNCFFDATTCCQMPFDTFDYVVDAIDTVTSKLLLAEICHKQGIPLVSCMGTGNKLHPELLQIADISQTSVCPLARVMRKELKARGVPSLKVVFSKEPPVKLDFQPTENGRHIPASISFVPPTAGMLLASAVVNDLIKM